MNGRGCGEGPVVDTAAVQGVIFDMDGVVTDTASVHAVAWKRLFDEFLRDRAGREGSSFRPFDIEEDYLRHVDGRPRYDGVRGFLDSRGITLPEGEPSDPPGDSTVCALGTRKDGYFLDQLRRGGPRPYPSTIRLAEELSARHVRTAVISASRNMTEVLGSAGLLELFDARVDGVVSDDLHLPGKPDPAIFLEAARRLEIPPRRAAIVEDSLAGVEAGRAGGFALVVGVDRHGRRDDLLRSGADVVVADLVEVRVE